jgi:hypothetical protein
MYYVIIGYVLFAIGVVATLGSVSIFFIDETKDLPWIIPKFIFLFVSMGWLSFLILRLPAKRLLIFALIMLIMRIGFNWTVIPARYQLDRGIPAKEGALQVARMTKGEPLWILGWSDVDDFSAFYITRERREILPRKYEDIYEINKDVFYIADQRRLANKDYRLFYTYRTHWQERKLKLVKILNEYPYQ